MNIKEVKNLKIDKTFFNDKKTVNIKTGKESFSGLNDSERLKNTIYKSIAYPSKIYYPHIQKFIREYSEEGDVVLDSFSGSGSTGIAAAIENRKAILIDDSPYANFIQEFIFNSLDFTAINKHYKKLVKNLEPDFNKLYSTKTSSGKNGILQTIISSNIFECPGCAELMDLNNNETGVRSVDRLHLVGQIS